MEHGCLMKALPPQVATFIVQKILLDDVGLDYICTTAERFFAVGRVLGNMVAALAEQPSSRLLKHIIRCYLRLSDNPRLVTNLQLHACLFLLPPKLPLAIHTLFVINFQNSNWISVWLKQGLWCIKKLSARHVKRCYFQHLPSCKYL